MGLEPKSFIFKTNLNGPYSGPFKNKKALKVNTVKAFTFKSVLGMGVEPTLTLL